MNISQLKSHFDSNRYIDKYFQIIEKYREGMDADIVERHHILPKSMFPQYEKESWNLITLSLKAHFICHMLLALGTRTQKMSAAFIMMSSGRTKNSLTYSIARRLCSEFTSVIRDGEMKYIHKGDLDDFLIDGWVEGNATTGKLSIVYQPLGVIKQIPYEEYEAFLSQGWCVGNINMGRTQLTKGGVVKFVEPKEVEQLLKQGWIPGNAIKGKRIFEKDGEKLFFFL